MNGDTFRLDWTKDENGTGWLCVVYSSNLWSKPTRVSHWWPVVTATAREAQEQYNAPMPVRDAGQGIFNGKNPFGQWISFHLKDGGKTQPIRTDTADVPPPKTRVETKYESGQWWRYLKASGWVRS